MHQLRLIDEPMEACQFPMLAPTTGFGRGCRCDRCRLGSPAHRVADLRSECEFDGCSALRVRYYRTCDEHKPVRSLKHGVPSKGALNIEACELCGRDHNWYESSLHASARQELHELHRRVCKGCIRPYKQTIRNHRLDSEWAYHLITAKLCDKCARPFSVDNHGRTTAVVDHDHDCCFGGGSCGLCVRGVICKRCNHTLGVYDQLDPGELDEIKRYLARSGPLDAHRPPRSDPFGALPRARS